MKKIHRFLISELPTSNSITIENTELVHLIKNVLKLSSNEECIVFCDGSDDYLTSINTVDKKAIKLDVQSIIPKKVISKNITAGISIIKKDNFELTVQKLTELGIRNIVPIISTRTVKQDLRLDRLQKISDEALEQSGGSYRVHISEPQTLKECLENKKESPQYCFDMNTKNYQQTPDKELTFYIGPEGGWGDEDKEIFKNYKVNTCNLGKTILRAETAAIVAGYTLLWGK